MSYHRSTLAAVALALLTTLPAAASTATIAQIVGSPSRYDGHHVDVKGTVEHFQRGVSHQGNPYVTYSLCSGQCIHVFAFGNPNTSNGQTITVHGMFETKNYISGYTLHNGIEADGGPNDSQDPCG